MKIREIFQTLLKNWALKQLTPANVQAVLTALLAQLRSVTDGTSTKVDDWVVDFLESVVADEKKIGVMVEFVKSGVDRVCMDVETFDDGKEYDQYNALAQRLDASSDGVCEFSFDKIVMIANLLREIVPILIDFFKENQE